MAQRIEAVDILRGVAVAIMINLDNPPATTYYLLHHAVWEGLTIADMAFPGFVFSMGISAAISISRRSPDLKKILKRSVILFLLGLLLVSVLPYVLALFLWTEFSSADFFSRAIEHCRLPGILQRLALTYLLGMILIKFLESDRKILVAAFGILFFYSAGFHIFAPESPFAEENNFSGFVDATVLGANHLLTPANDPEGLCGTFSSVAQMLLGFFVGKILLKEISLNQKIFQLLLCGIIFLAIGGMWSCFDIVAKKIWTAPFALITSGIEIFLLAVILKVTPAKIFQPLQVLGKSPLFFFAGSVLGLIVLGVWRIENISAWHWLYQHTTQGIGSTEFSSMLFCLMWFVLWILIAEILDRKNIVIKI